MTGILLQQTCSCVHRGRHPSIWMCARSGKYLICHGPRPSTRTSRSRSRKLPLGALQRLARCLLGSDNCVQDEMCASRQTDGRHIPGRIRFQLNKRPGSSCLNWLLWKLLNLTSVWRTVSRQRTSGGRDVVAFKIILTRRCTVAEKQRMHTTVIHTRIPKNIQMPLLPLAQHTRHFWLLRLIFGGGSSR